MGTSGTPGPGGRGRMAYRLQRRQAGARRAEWETLAEQFSQTRERNLKLERDSKFRILSIRLQPSSDGFPRGQPLSWSQAWDVSGPGPGTGRTAPARPLGFRTAVTAGL